jgi:hypothetical protein
MNKISDSFGLCSVCVGVRGKDERVIRESELGRERVNESNREMKEKEE